MEESSLKRLLKDDDEVLLLLSIVLLEEGEGGNLNDEGREREQCVSRRLNTGQPESGA